MKYVIGLDIGIASIGYAIVRLDADYHPDKIIFLDSIVFPKAEDEYGNSLAGARGELRRNRRTHRRTKYRKEQVKNLFTKNHLLTKSEIKDAFYGKGLIPIYNLRAKGLDYKLSNLELFRVLYNLVGHRGFKSTRKYNDISKGVGALKASIQDTKDKLRQSSYRSLGELLYKDDTYKNHKRNKSYDDGYLFSASRKMIKDEAKNILNAQIQMNDNIHPKFRDAYLSILRSQRNFDDGPGHNSYYAGNQIEKLIGNDTLAPERPRAAKATITFAHFQILSNLSNLRYSYSAGDEWHTLSPEQYQKVLQEALHKKTMTYNHIKKIMGVPKSVYFNLVNYNTKAGDSQHFSDLRDIQAIQSLLPDPFDTDEYIDKIGTLLTLYKSDKGRSEQLRNIGIDDDTIRKLLSLNFKRFSKLSLRTMQDLIPYLKQGYQYSDACAKAGYDFNNIPIDKKYIQDNVPNPVVKRATLKTIKVVDRIIKHYGKPYSIHIELARDIGKSYDERRKIEKRQQHNQEHNEGIANKLKELGFRINGKNITKLKLLEAQNYMDPYTKNGDIDIERALNSDNFYQVDHIFPYSLSFDDSLGNKVITTAKANQEKGNRLPLEYLQGHDDDVQWLKKVASMMQSPKKRAMLLKPRMSPEDMNDWKQRNLQDTSYINRLLNHYFQQNIDFAAGQGKRRVISVNGQMTAKMRSRWGITKNREASDIHHAIDAVVIASINTSLVQRITKYSHYHEINHNSKIWKPQDKKLVQEYRNKPLMKSFINDFPIPWPDFRDEIQARTSANPKAMMEGRSWTNYSNDEIQHLKPIIVIRTPRKKINGQIHNETLRSPKLLPQGKIMYRVNVEDLYLDQNNNIKAKGNAYYQISEDGGNQHLAQSLRKVLSKKQIMEQELKSLSKAKDDKSKKKSRKLRKQIKELFPKGFFKFQANGKNHYVRKVKVTQAATTGVTMNHQKAFATNARFSMIRLDIFYTGKKYVMIPIYRSQIKQHQLPNTYRSNKKYYSLKDTDQFMFSIHRDDLIYIVTKETKKKPSQKIFGYFIKASVGSGGITIQSHDGSQEYNGFGIASLKRFQKYNINYLGEYHIVHEKYRNSFK